MEEATRTEYEILVVFDEPLVLMEVAFNAVNVESVEVTLWSSEFGTQVTYCQCIANKCS